jgi:hypothetical protein
MEKQFVFVQIHYVRQDTNPITGVTSTAKSTNIRAPERNAIFDEEMAILTEIVKPVQILTYTGDSVAKDVLAMNVVPNSRERLHFPYIIHQAIVHYKPSDPASVQALGVAVRRMGHLRNWLLFGDIDILQPEELQPSLIQSIYPFEMWETLQFLFVRLRPLKELEQEKQDIKRTLQKLESDMSLYLTSLRRTESINVGRLNRLKENVNYNSLKDDATVPQYFKNLLQRKSSLTSNLKRLSSTIENETTRIVREGVLAKKDQLNAKQIRDQYVACVEFLRTKVENIPLGDTKDTILEYIDTYDLDTQIILCHKRFLFLIFYAEYAYDYSPELKSLVQENPLTDVEIDLQTVLDDLHYEGKAYGFMKQADALLKQRKQERMRQKKKQKKQAAIPSYIPYNSTAVAPALPSIPEEGEAVSMTANQPTNQNWTFDEFGQFVPKNGSAAPIPAMSGRFTNLGGGAKRRTRRIRKHRQKTRRNR